MVSRLQRAWSALDLEERILNGAAIISLVSITLPWLSGEWLGGDAVTYTGFGFYTSFIGIIVFLLLLFIVLMTALPLLGGPIVIRRKQRDVVRLCAASQVSVLLLAALSVLMKVTYEYSRIEIRFGIYSAIIGSIIVTFYAFVRWQEEKRNDGPELFHHPEDRTLPAVRDESLLPPPPPPPPPPAPLPEDHRLRP